MQNSLEISAEYFNVDIKADSPIYVNGNRLDLAKLFHKLNFKKGAEIGVFDGQYSKMLCENIPGVKLYAVDSWEVYDDLPELSMGKDSLEVNYLQKIEESWQRAKKLLANYDCELIKKYSLDAVKDFERNSLDFVYIDGNHSFDYVMEDIIEWSRIVRSGGIVSGHDFSVPRYRNISVQVQTAVKTYSAIHNIEPLFVTDDRRSSSWFFVKP